MKKLFSVSIFFSLLIGQQEGQLFLKENNKYPVNSPVVGKITINEKTKLASVETDKFKMDFAFEFIDKIDFGKGDVWATINKRVTDKCNKEKEVKILIYNLVGDEYNLLEDLSNQYTITTCHEMVDFFSLQKYFVENNIDESKLNDYLLLKAAQNFGAQYVITGNVYRFTVPVKYTETDFQSTGFSDLSRNVNTLSDAIGLLPDALSEFKSKSARANAINNAGNYVNMNLYSINVKDYSKKTLMKNQTVLRLD